jgi:hypothetical protein
MPDCLRCRTRPPIGALSHEFANFSHEWRRGELAGNNGERAIWHEHASQLCPRELGVNEVKGIGDQRQVN